MARIAGFPAADAEWCGLAVAVQAWSQAKALDAQHEPATPDAERLGELHLGRGLGDAEDAPGGYVSDPARQTFRNLRVGVRLRPLGPGRESSVRSSGAAPRFRRTDMSCSGICQSRTSDRMNPSGRILL